MRPNIALAVLLCLLALGLLSFCSLFFGSGQLSLIQVWRILLNQPAAASEVNIVWVLRGSRVPIALLAGAALGVAGALCQTLTRNPLADPGLLGVNAGAALAVAICYTLVSGPTVGLTMAAAMGGAALAGAGVLAVGGVLTGKHDTLRLILGGAALSAIASAATHWLILANPRSFEAFRGWASGTVMLRSSTLILACALLVTISVLLVLVMARQLNALALGDEMARALGTSPQLTWAVVAAATVGLSGTATVLVGPIGFLGLAAPLAVRALVGPRAVPLVLGSALTGATALLFADVVGRVILPPREVAAGIVCALLGGPLFVGAARGMRVARP